MKRRVGALLAEVTQGEAEKFTAPIVLVHGLWSTETVWRGFSGYLAHRGWTCVALRLRGRDGTGVESIDEHASDLLSVISSLPAPPVILGHDLGALLALRAGEHASALVLIAPLIPPPVGNLDKLPSPDGWLARWRGEQLRAPRGRIGEAYGANDPDVREPAALLRRLRAEASPLVTPARPVPSLVVTGGRDPLTEVDAARRLAECLRADLDVEPERGHALISEPGWEERVSKVHRWLVKRLGVSLLALYEESQEE
jgi:pimeloyl-ACP methyl ester carboxylesterase